MSLFQAFTLAYHLVAMVICSSLAMLVISQLHQDKTSRLFAALMICVALIAFWGTLSRLARELNYGDDWVFLLFNLGSCFTALLPSLVLVFYTELLHGWNPWRRWTAAVLVTATTAAVVLFPLGRVYRYFNMDANGYVTYQLTPDINFLLVFGEAGILLTLVSVFSQYRKFRDKQTRRLFIGIVAMCVGYLLIAIPAANRWVPQIAFFSLSGVIIAGPILRQRLFDPLTQLNVKLSRRAEQLGIITRVGQQANSLLELNLLLATIVKDIQQAFGYNVVTIYLLNRDTKVLEPRAIAGTTPKENQNFEVATVVDNSTFVGAAAMTKQIVNVGIVQSDPRYRENHVRPNTQSTVSLPMLLGTSTNVEGETLIGILDIQSQQAHAFSNEDVDVLNILVQQISTAIQNAQLFEEAQIARLAADEANRKKTLFLSEMSHELRTPLQTVISRSQWMLNHPDQYEGVQLPEIYVKEVARIEVAGKHLHGLINHILDLSKIEVGEYEIVTSRINPVQILHDVEKTYTGLLAPDVEFRSIYVSTLPDIFADELNLTKVLGNLVGNACKFTQQGSITLDASVQGIELCFSVADTGPGIPAETQANLFSPYFQGSTRLKRQEGTGLGLYLCKQLVSLLKGRIWFESVVGQGSTFYFTVPLASGEPDFVADTSPQGSRAIMFSSLEPKDLPIQLVVVDENVQTREQAEIVLTRAEYEVVIARTMHEAMVFGKALEPTAILVMTHQANALQGTEFLDLWRATANNLATEIIHFEIDSDNATWQTALPNLLKQRINRNLSTTAAVREPPLLRDIQ